MKKILITCSVIAALITASCKKSDNAIAKEQTNFLTTGSWKNVSTEWQTTGGAWVPPPTWASATYPSVLTFLETYTYTSNLGAAGTWQYSTDKKQIILMRNAVSFTATIEVLNGSALQLSRPMDPNTTYTTQTVNGSTTYTYYNKERTNFTH